MKAPTDLLQGAMSLARGQWLSIAVELSTRVGSVTRVRLREEPGSPPLCILLNRLSNVLRGLSRVAHRLGVRP